MCSQSVIVQHRMNPTKGLSSRTINTIVLKSGSTIQGDHILAFSQTQKSGSIPEKFQREHLEHTSQRFARHAQVILTTLWLITYRK